MYIAPSSGHISLNFNMPLKLFFLRRFEVVFWCLEWECCTFWKIDGNSFKSTNTIQCVPQKRKPVFSVRYLLCHARSIQTIYFIIKSIFSSFIWYQTHNDISMHEWKGTIQTHACQKRFAQNNGVPVCWVDMTKFRLANPCQNKESKQKKHDKRDKRNGEECLFNTSLCSESWQTPLTIFEPLNSHSAQIIFDITI